jgi:arylsulfatase A-like enzyme
VGDGSGGAEPAGSYAGFEGKVGQTFAGSEPWWPPRPAAPRGAPNVVVVLADDLGFSDIGCYGSEIGTPHLDALAAVGIRFTDFHVTPMCSPTRAALLTGVNPHLAGVGHVSNSDPGFPGYASELADDVTTMAELFRASGWSTFAIGKWHLTKDVDMSDAGTRKSWPLQRGFDRYYGFLEAFTNFHHPHRLVEDNHTVEVDRYPDGYYLTDDLTDHAISMIRSAKASDPTKPFLLYFAHGAVHAPLQAKPGDMRRHRDAYNAGWDVIRAARHRRQIELGIIDEGLALAPRNSEEGDDVRPWDDLTSDEHRLFARYMEIYAAMVDSIDQSVGRLRQALDDIDVLEDTIFLFTSDNGGSREGEAEGTSAYFRSLVSKNITDIESVDDDLARIDELGGPRTLCHYPRGWAMVSNTPFRLYKINTHAGGHTVPLIVSWPAQLHSRGEMRRQWAFVTDVLPTVLELAGIDASAGQADSSLQPMQGTSFAPVLGAGGSTVEHPHTEQYFEMQGHRGFYRHGWELVTRHMPRTPFGPHEWELYDLQADRTEIVDLAATHPERVRELAEGWEAAALRNQVYPLDEGSGLRYLTRPEWEDPLRAPVRLVRGTHTLERYRSQLLIQWRSFTVDLELRAQPGDQGVLLAHGDQGGGYAVYVDDAAADHALVYVHNGYGETTELRTDPLPEHCRHVRLAVTAPGGWRWNVALEVDGRPVGMLQRLVMPAAMAPFEGIDVGIDRRSPVSWDIYQRHGPFPFTGELFAATYTPGELAPDAGSRFVDLVRELGMRYE